MDTSTYKKAIKLLEADTLKNIATLKYLTLYRKDVTVQVIEDKVEWAVLSSFPTSILSFDTNAYPKAKVAFYINGTSEQIKHRLLDTLPQNNYVLRLNEPLDLSRLEKHYEITRGNTYLSYTCSRVGKTPAGDVVLANAKLNEEAITLISRNGHHEKDIRNHFTHGAKWFGVRIDNEIKSICFTFQDYGNIWEIGGVRTLEAERNKGYAHSVVYSALKYILERKLIPRYTTEEKNTNSIKLAESLGMKQFLRMEHCLLDPI